MYHCGKFLSFNFHFDCIVSEKCDIVEKMCHKTRQQVSALRIECHFEAKYFPETETDQFRSQLKGREEDNERCKLLLLSLENV